MATFSVAKNNLIKYANQLKLWIENQQAKKNLKFCLIICVYSFLFKKKLLQDIKSLWVI